MKIKYSFLCFVMIFLIFLSGCRTQAQNEEPNIEESSNVEATSWISFDTYKGEIFWKRSNNTTRYVIYVNDKMISNKSVNDSNDQKEIFSSDVNSLRNTKENFKVTVESYNGRTMASYTKEFKFTEGIDINSFVVNPSDNSFSFSKVEWATAYRVFHKNEEIVVKEPKVTIIDDNDRSHYILPTNENDTSMFSQIVQYPYYHLQNLC